MATTSMIRPGSDDAPSSQKPQSPRWAFERAVRESDLCPSDRLVLFVIAQEINGSLENIKHSPARSEIAKRTGLSPAGVDKCISRLTKSGWLSNSEGRGHWPKWTLRTPSSPGAVLDDASGEKPTSLLGREDIPTQWGGTSLPSRDNQTFPDLPDQKQANEPPEQSKEKNPMTETTMGRGRVSFRTPPAQPAHKKEEKTPSNDRRLTGSAALDLIREQFSDSVEQEMASEFVKALRTYDPAEVIKAAGFFFRGRRLSGIREPRRYARSVVSEIQATVDGWKAQEAAWGRMRVSARQEAKHRAAQAERQQLETAEMAAKGYVKIEALAVEGDVADVPDWLPAEEAEQVEFGGCLVWVPKS